jgi:uncharacterized protein GlcG (DUF336 family)
LTTLTQQEAQAWVAKAQRKAEQMNVKVSISVVDGSGIPVAFTRMDGAGILTPDIARAKAYTAVVFKRNTKDTAEGMKERVLAATSLMQVTQGKVVILAGGVIVKRGDEVIGGIGVSGATSDEDHECALEATS